MPATVIAYTDGACIPNPGPGGWAAILLEKGKRRTLTGSEPRTTNNRMEMQAAIAALDATDPTAHLTMHSDSQLLVRGATEWLTGWKAKGWRTASKTPVANIDLWKGIDARVQARDGKTEWVWVRGHATDPLNIEVDALANAAAMAEAAKVNA